jgi:DNA-directed RNA polymerase specialized sigma24 family protein
LIQFILPVLSRVFFALNDDALPVQYFYDLNQEPEIDKKLWVKERCHKCLTGSLHCLKNEARLALLLLDLAALPYDEIAQIMNKKESTVRQLVSRSRQKVNCNGSPADSLNIISISCF